MASKTCKCSKTLRPGESHSCPRQNGQQVRLGDDGNFALSMAIGYVTDNPVLGGMVGGSFTGGIVGASLNDNDSSGSDGGGGGGD